MAQTITPAIKAYLEEPRFAVLATINPDGTPQQTVMWFEFRGDHVMMNTARGRKKDRNLLRDPRISICVEDGYRYVSLSGPVTLVEDQSVAQQDIASLAHRYSDREAALKMIEGQFAKEERITILMKVEDIDASGFAS